LKEVPALSGRLIPEFDKRRNIRDMFSKKPSLSKTMTGASYNTVDDKLSLKEQMSEPLSATRAAYSMVAGRPPEVSRSPSFDKSSDSRMVTPTPSPLKSPPKPLPISKRKSVDTNTSRPLKRTKSGTTTSGNNTPGSLKGQQSLRGFLKAKPQPSDTAVDAADSQQKDVSMATASKASEMAYGELAFSTVASIAAQPTMGQQFENTSSASGTANELGAAQSDTALQVETKEESASFVDPVAARESWSKLFTKPAAPRCEGHDEPCITLTTKKPGMNCGRAFWMCSRPIGPSGKQEKGTQWRCPTFIWCSDWNSGAT